MAAEEVTAMTKIFTDAITSMSAPVITILTAAASIIVIFMLFRLGVKAFGTVSKGKS